MNALLLGFLLLMAPQESRPPVAVILDGDFGDLDDPFALALVLSCPELDLIGVTTTGGEVQARSRLVSRFFSAIGRSGVPIASGLAPEGARPLGATHFYSFHPDASYNRTQKLLKQGAVAFLHEKLKERPNELTIVCLGSLVNIARLLEEHPEAKPWIKRLVLPGGFREDPSAQTLLASGIPMIAVSTGGVPMRLEKPVRSLVFEARTPLTRQLQALDQMIQEPAPPLSDLARIAVLVEEGMFKTEKVDGVPTAVVSDVESMLCWAGDRIASGGGEQAKARAPVNVSTLVPRGGMPNRVHAMEDFETDIERRWWMSGVPETKNLPPGSVRACRGVLTHDFDDLMGPRFKEMFTAVVFNPVPGPPMGKRPRLSFRYWLRGTDTLRVQIYSLSNGYHRHLTLTGLPEGRWEEGAVDMTAVRRPDGSGGPLSEGERIDDIQFYTDPDAELLIDDIVLYDGAAPEETRPFPKRIHFTGTFDTGKQGKEWPGTFDLAQPGVPPTAKAARSVASPEHGAPWIRLHLRGERVLGDSTTLIFRHRLKGADSLRVALVDRTDGKVHTVELKNISPGEWSPASVDIAGPRSGHRTDELHFLVPPGGELLIDDVLLFEPGVSGTR